MTADIMTNRYSCVYITGTSGIGKSLYLLYLMYELVQAKKISGEENPTILYKTRDSECFLLLSNGDVQKSTMSSPVFQDSVPNCVLIDSVDVQTVDSQFGPHILVASNTKYFKEFQKRVDEVGSKGKKFYMDLWSKDELQLISAYHIDILNLRYDVFGGSARNFKLDRRSTSADNEQFSGIVDSMLKLFFDGRLFSVERETWNATLFSIKNAIVEQLNVVDEVSGSAQAFTSMFYHLHNTGQQTWATNFLKCLAGKIIDMRVLNLSERLKLLIGESGIGIAFESLGHETLLKSNVEHKATSIVKYQRPGEFQFKVPVRVEVFRGISDICKLPSDCYGLPVNGNFPCVDAVIQPNILLQFTVSRHHPGIEDKTKDIRANLLSTDKKEHRLVFVVPKEHLNGFNKQDGYGDIKQYVMTYCAFHEGGAPMAVDA